MSCIIEEAKEKLIEIMGEGSERASLIFELNALMDAVKASSTLSIYSFKPNATEEEKRFSKLSNFNAGPVMVNGKKFETIEHAFQYQKAMFFGDTETANRLLAARYEDRVSIGNRETKAGNGIWKPASEIKTEPKEETTQTNNPTNKNFDRDLDAKLRDTLTKLYPEIKLEYTEDEIQYIDSNGNVMNQEETSNLVKYTLKVVDTLYDIGTPKKSKHGGNSQPVRSTIKLNSKESPNIEKNLTKYLAGKGVSKEQIEYMFDYMKQNSISEIGTLDLAERLLFGLTQNVEIKEGFLTEIKYKKRVYDEGKAWSVGSYDYLINELNNARNLKKRTVGDIYHISASHRDEDTGKSFKIEEDSTIARKGLFSKDKISVKTSYFVNGIEMTKEEFKKDLDEVTKERVEVVKSNRYKDLTVPGGTNYKEVEIKTPNVKAELKGHADFATDEGIGWYRVDDGEAGELRVLEMQSDMFQQRKDKDLSKSNLSSNKLYDEYLSETDKRKIDDLLEHRDSLIEHGEYSKDDEDAINADIVNIEKPYREKLQQTVLDKAFHQILNTDNKWVKFFIQSIVQNAQRNGYEKIKFPAGETVAKIEGYSNFDRDNRANYEHNKNLDKKIFDLQSELNNTDLSDQKRDSLQIKLSNLLSQRKEVKSGQSFDVMDFYQVRVQNTLKNLYGKDKVKTVTDGHGNKWFELELDSKRGSQAIMLQQQGGKIKGQANIEAGTVLINSLLQSQDTLPHEYAHHYIAWFRDTPIVQEAIKKWGSEEALVQAIGEQVVKQKGEAYGWWEKFTQWLQSKFNKLDKATKEELKNLLTDSFLTRQNLKEPYTSKVYPKSNVPERVSTGKGKTVSARFGSGAFNLGRQVKNFDKNKWAERAEKILRSIMIKYYKGSAEGWALLQATNGKKLLHPTTSEYEEIFPKILMEIRDANKPKSVEPVQLEQTSFKKEIDIIQQQLNEEGC